MQCVGGSSRQLMLMQPRPKILRQYLWSGLAPLANTIERSVVGSDAACRYHYCGHCFTVDAATSSVIREMDVSDTVVGESGEVLCFWCTVHAPAAQLTDVDRRCRCLVRRRAASAPVPPAVSRRRRRPPRRTTSNDVLYVNNVCVTSSHGSDVVRRPPTRRR